VQHEHGKKTEILTSCFDIVAYILVLTMIFISIFPNILFFPAFLKNGNIPTVELYSNLENNNIPGINPGSNLKNDNISSAEFDSDREGIQLEYTVIQNDTMRRIMLQHGGRENDWQKIVTLNPVLQERGIEGKLADDESPLIYIGDVLKIPFFGTDVLEKRNIPTAEVDSNLENGNIPSTKLYFSDKPFVQGFLLKFPVTSMIGIPFSSYNFYSYFVFVFNLIYSLAGIHFLILFPVTKIVLSTLRSLYNEQKK
jgi:hypothetical protein